MQRVLTTHTGSLIRPAELVRLAADPHRDEERYQRELEQAVAETVRRQADVGVDVIDDGEMGKPNWITYLYERTEGIEPREVMLPPSQSTLPPSRDRNAFPGFYADHDTELYERRRRALGVPEGESLPSTLWVCTGPLRYDPAPLQRDIENFRSALAGVEVTDAFLPVVAPASAYWLTNEHYATDEEFVAALGEVLAQEYRAIVDAGFLVQVDDAVLVHELDSMLADGRSIDEYRRWAQLRVDATNQALSGIPTERIRYHVCWGSWHVPHAFDPSLADVVDLVLSVRAGYYLIEQANSRHEHEWHVWERTRLPEGSVLVPGVVTHHTHIVEHPELVAERLVRIAEVVGPENVMGGTDCGFAQSAFMQRVHPEIQWAKLAALAEGARIASERLARTDRRAGARST